MLSLPHTKQAKPKQDTIEELFDESSDDEISDDSDSSSLDACTPSANKRRPTIEWKDTVGKNQVTNEIQYNPSTTDFRSQYNILEELYNEKLSPAKILKVERNSDKSFFIFKIIEKAKLFGDF